MARPGLCLLPILSLVLVTAALQASPSPLLVPTPHTTPAEGADPLSPQQKREVADLVNAFRRSAADPEARAKAADRIFEIGGSGPSRLLVAVNTEMRPLYARYQQDFVKQALQAVRTKLKDVKPPDVEALRKTIMDAVGLADLSKETVVAKADPALKKLEEMLLVSREDVLKDATALQDERAKLLALGEYWQRCTDAVAKQESPAPASAPAPAGASAPASASATTAPVAGPADFKKRLEKEEDTATLLVLAPDDAARKVLTDNVGKESKIQAEEAAGVLLLNRIRLLTGLKPLAIDPLLCDAGRDHSKDMATKGFFAHESPVPGKKTPWDRASKFGTSASAENIYMGSTSGRDAIMGWWHSPGHLKNMTGGHSRVGLGCYEKHWTQMFG